MSRCLQHILAVVLLLKFPSLPVIDGKDLKIIGGLEAQPHEFPYLVGIAIRQPVEKSSWCGGALIARQFVLTAAHCLKGVNLATLYIGAHNVRNITAATLTVDIQQRHILLHRNWTPRYVVHDIAMIHLPQRLDYAATIQPIALPSRNTSAIETGFLLSAAGWGRTSPDVAAPRPATVHKLNLRVTHEDECKSRYHYYNVTLNICLEGNMERTTCRGDSGGPLVETNAETGNQTLVALTSYGSKCDSPTVLTRILPYMDWIEERLTAMY